MRFAIALLSWLYYALPAASLRRPPGAQHAGPHALRSMADAQWNTLEDYCLLDAVERFTLSNGRTVLWRQMHSRVPELSVYAIEHLQRRYAQLRPGQVDLQLLPMLDSWAHVGGGTYAGSVYGLPGVQDGTSILTPPVEPADRCVLEGYLSTSAGGVAVVYELGSTADDGVSGSEVGLLSKSRARQMGMQTVALASAIGVSGIGLWAAWGHHLGVHIFVV